MPRGWLLLLCAVLFVWQPLGFAGELARSLPSLGMRGWPGAVELIAHGVVAVLAIAAGWSLWIASPHGPAAARVALTGAAIIGVQSLYWSALPRHTLPGSELPLALLLIGHAAAWLAYLNGSTRICAMET